MSESLSAIFWSKDSCGLRYISQLKFFLEQSLYEMFKWKQIRMIEMLFQLESKNIFDDN